MKIETRYRFETIPLTLAEARLDRQYAIEHIQNQIEALQEELKELLSSPMPTERTKQIALEPGDPGYEDAPFALQVENYQGDFVWQQIPK